MQMQKPPASSMELLYSTEAPLSPETENVDVYLTDAWYELRSQLLLLCLSVYFCGPEF